MKYYENLFVDSLKDDKKIVGFHLYKSLIKCYSQLHDNEKIEYYKIKLKEIGEFNRFVNDLNERDENRWHRNAMTVNDAKLYNWNPAKRDDTISTAINYFERLKRSPHPDVNVTSTTYTILFYVFGRFNNASEFHMEKLLHYYQEMLNDVKFQPNIYMYNALIWACGKQNDLDRVEYFFNEIKLNGCIPEESTFVNVILAYARSYNLEKIQYYEDLVMNELYEDVFPGFHLYHTLVLFYGKLYDYDKVQFYVNKLKEVGEFKRFVKYVEENPSLDITITVRHQIEGRSREMVMWF